MEFHLKAFALMKMHKVLLKKNNRDLYSLLSQTIYKPWEFENPINELVFAQCTCCFIRFSHSLGL